MELFIEHNAVIDMPTNVRYSLFHVLKIMIGHDIIIQVFIPRVHKMEKRV